MGDGKINRGPDGSHLRCVENASSNERNSRLDSLASSVEAGDVEKTLRIIREQIREEQIRSMPTREYPLRITPKGGLYLIES